MQLHCIPNNVDTVTGNIFIANPMKKKPNLCSFLGNHLKILMGQSFTTTPECKLKPENASSNPVCTYGTIISRKTPQQRLLGHT